MKKIIIYLCFIIPLYSEDDWSFFMRKAQREYKLESYKRAIFYLDNILSPPNNTNKADIAEAYKLLGDCYDKLKNQYDAQEAYEKSLSYKPNQSNLILYLALYYRDVRSHIKAITYFEKYLILDPSNRKVAFQYILSLSRVGQKKKSKEILKKAASQRKKKSDISKCMRS